MEKTKQSKKVVINSKSAIILMGAICFFLFIYAPGTIYFGNISDFSYDFYDFIKLMIPFALFCWFLLSCLLVIIRVFSNKLYLICIAVLISFFISSFLEGSFFSKFIPAMTGASIKWHDYVSHRWISIVIWGGIVVAFLFLLRRLGGNTIEKIALTVGVCGFLFLLISFALSGIPNGYVNKTDYVPTNNHIFECSENENFIVLLLDSIDGETYYELSKKHPEYKDDFEDFTFFRNTMGVYPATEYAVPFILGGEWYENQEPLEQYRLNAFEKSPLLSFLAEDEWDIGMYMIRTYMPQTSEALQQYNNVEEASNFTDNIAFLKMQLMITGVKYFPFDIKPFCELSPADIAFDSRKTTSSDNEYNGNDEEFYSNLLENNVDKVSNNKFIFIHLNGAHAPFTYDANMNIVENATYNSSVEASMTIAQKYLEALKIANVYDNSIIIIMADHGSNQEDSSFDRQNPLLMIKGKNENHNYCISNAPISFTDLQEAYIRLLKGSSAENSFNWTEGDKRERRYLFYFVGTGDDVLKEMTQYGDAWDETSMALTGNEY